MPSHPFIAARIERALDERMETLVRSFGWRDSIIGYTGYGTTAKLRVLGRIVLTPRGRMWPRDRRDGIWTEGRGWRNFASVAAVDRAARVQVGNRTVEVLADRDGYLDFTVEDHGLSPGWHYITIATDDTRPVRARVLVLGDEVRYGIISDIDDTVITTHLPRFFVAAWNTLFVAESARLPVAGMAQLFREMLRRYPGAPFCYVSTGSWTTLPFLERFTLRHGYPAGPMLLSDWGPTNTGWLRSGIAHKSEAIRTLARDLPNVRWWLVGDDGQHDPMIYADFARQHPDNVAGVLIRELNPVELVLAHGTWHELDRTHRPDIPAGVPEFRGPDGPTLWSQLQPYLDRQLTN
jgi:phosphatidate phosphatase APP1